LRVEKRKNIQGLYKKPKTAVINGTITEALTHRKIERY